MTAWILSLIHLIMRWNKNMCTNGYKYAGKSHLKRAFFFFLFRYETFSLLFVVVVFLFLLNIPYFCVLFGLKKDWCWNLGRYLHVSFLCGVFLNHTVHALVSRNSGNESNEAMTQEGTLDKMIIPVASLINAVFHICRYLYLETCAIIWHVTALTRSSRR